MINCNPETVSTDFNMADKLYFEPVFWEHVREIIDLEKPEGVIVQLGGQTALKMRSEEHTSELQSLMRISYAVFCLKKKTETNQNKQHYVNTLSENINKIEHM